MATGKPEIDFGSCCQSVYEVLLQSDGKIVTVGFPNSESSDSDFALARLNSAGALRQHLRHWRQSALCFVFVGSMRAQQSPAERVAEIQAALRDTNLDGWLFYDFRYSDPLAYRILKLDENMSASRRWFYYIPASGEPVKIVQSIEQFKLDSLPGRKLVFRGWKELHARLREVLGAASKKSKSRIAMQYSPMNDIPYISRVDAGTIELVRSFGVEPVTSAELVQRFEAVFSPAQHEMHVDASDKMHRIIQEAFAEIARRMRANEPTTEWDIAQFMLRRYSDEGMQQEPMIVAVNANAADPTLHADKGKEFTDQARRFCPYRRRYETEQTRCRRD